MRCYIIEQSFKVKMHKKSTSHTEHKSVKRGQHISKHGRGAGGRRGKSEPVVERNPGQLYKSRRWQSDERQKDATREPRDPREEKKALSGSKYTNIKGADAKNDVPCSAPITTRNLLANEKPVNEEPVNDENSADKNDVTEIQTEIPPSAAAVEQSNKASARKRRKTKRRKKSSSDKRRSSLRHRKHPFLVNDDGLVVDDDNFEGDDEHGSSTDDLNIKSRARYRKISRRSCTRRGRESSTVSSDDEENNLGATFPRLQPLTHQPQTNQQLQADTRLRNIPQEYRKRAAALRTRSPTDYILNGFSQASMRVFEFATGACANAECTYNNARARTESCNRNTPCVTSQLPPILARGIVSGGGCIQPATATLVDDDPGPSQRVIAGPRSFTQSQLPPLLNVHRDGEHAQRGVQ